MTVTVGVPGVKVVVPDGTPTVCHAIKAGAPLTLCGMTPSPEPIHDGYYIDGRCTGCGRPACTTCSILEVWA